MPAHRVYLIRHGQTAWNVLGRWQGFEAVPLNEEGLAQATALASYWTRPLSAVYSSDLSRAVQTAELLAKAAGVPLISDSRLREFNLGVFQGMTMDEIRAHYPSEADTMFADYMGFIAPNGESRYDLQNRMYAAWSDIVEREPGEVAIVTHGTALKVLLFKLFGETPELRNSHIDNTSITTVEWGEHGWTLAELTVTPHLTAPVTDQDQQ